MVGDHMHDTAIVLLTKSDNLFGNLGKLKVESNDLVDKWLFLLLYYAQKQLNVFIFSFLFWVSQEIRQSIQISLQTVSCYLKLYLKLKKGL